MRQDEVTTTSKYFGRNYFGYPLLFHQGTDTSSLLFLVPSMPAQDYFLPNYFGVGASVSHIILGGRSYMSENCLKVLFS